MLFHNNILLGPVLREDEKFRKVYVKGYPDTMKYSQAALPKFMKKLLHVLLFINICMDLFTILICKQRQYVHKIRFYNL